MVVKPRNSVPMKLNDFTVFLFRKLVNFCCISVKPEELLSSADMEALQRWSKMQKANVPIAPWPLAAPTGDGDKKPDTVAVNAGIQQPGVNTAAPPPDGETRVFHSNERNVQQQTLDLLQQRLLDNIREVKSESYDPQMKLQTESLPQRNDFDKEVAEFSVDFSNVPLGDLDFLSMVGPELDKILTNSLSMENENAIASVQPPISTCPASIFSSTASSSIPPTFTMSSSDTETFMQSLCATQKDITGGLSSHPFSQHTAAAYSQNSSNPLGVVANTGQNRLSPSQYQSDSQHSVSPVQGHSPQFFTTGNQQPTQNQSIVTQQQNFNQSPNFPSFSSYAAQPGVYAEQGASQMAGSQPASHVQQQGAIDGGGRSSSNSNSPPALQVNAHNSQLSFQNLFQTNTLTAQQLDVSRYQVYRYLSTVKSFVLIWHLISCILLVGQSTNLRSERNIYLF